MKGAAAVVALTALLWCCEGFLATNPLPPFPVPDSLEVYAQNTQNFFSYNENLFPSTNGTGKEQILFRKILTLSIVLYAVRTRQPGSSYMQHTVLKTRGVVDIINTTANASLSSCFYWR